MFSLISEKISCAAKIPVLWIGGGGTDDKGRPQEFLKFNFIPRKFLEMADCEAIGTVEYLPSLWLCWQLDLTRKSFTW